MKPTMKREVAVVHAFKVTGMISFYASADAVEEFKEFGRIFDFGGEYTITVDARYDFAEVLKYIENYGKEEA